MSDVAIKQLDRDLDNLRAARQWARDGGDAKVGLRMGIALRKYWQRRRYYHEGRVWLEELLALADGPSYRAAVAIRMRALHTAAWLASDQHDFARSAHLFEQSMALRHALGYSEADAPLLLNAVRRARGEEHYQHAATLFSDALSQHRAMGDQGSASSGGRGQSLYDLALVRREQGAFAEAVALFEEGIGRTRRSASVRGKRLDSWGSATLRATRATLQERVDIASKASCSSASWKSSRRSALPSITWRWARTSEAS